MDHVVEEIQWMKFAEETSRMMQQAELDETLNEKETTDGTLNLVVEIVSNSLLFLLIFGMSATVDMKNLIHQLKNKFAIGTGVAMQFLIMPFLGFAAVMLLRQREAGFTPAMGLTLLIVTASPGGSYSNWWCSTFNADLALSVAMTALSTIMSTFLLPANLLLYANAAYGFGQEDGTEQGENILKNINFGKIFISIAIVISAILLGLLASFHFHSHTFQRWCNRLGSLSGIALILVSAFLSSGGGGEGQAKLWDQDWSFYVAVSLPCIVGLVISNWLARLVRLDKPECVTLAVECCYQNVGIATSAAVSMFQDPQQRAEALLVPLFYGLVEAIILGFYCLAAWKAGWTKAPKNERLCVILVKTYEVVDDEDEDLGDSDNDPEMTDWSVTDEEAANANSVGEKKSVVETVETEKMEEDEELTKRQSWWRRLLGISSKQKTTQPRLRNDTAEEDDFSHDDDQLIISVESASPSPPLPKMVTSPTAPELLVDSDMTNMGTKSGRALMENWGEASPLSSAEGDEEWGTA
jgi:predicted Na+-dependent transporter